MLAEVDRDFARDGQLGEVHDRVRSFSLASWRQASRDDGISQYDRLA